jgi:hypothetical protein
MCNGGSDSTIEIGNGELRLGESTYTRSGAKKDLGDGWFEARYAQMAEGEDMGQTTLRMKITPQQVVLVDVANGITHTATLCQN